MREMEGTYAAELERVYHEQAEEAHEWVHRKLCYTYGSVCQRDPQHVQARPRPAADRLLIRSIDLACARSVRRTGTSAGTIFGGRWAW